MSEESRRTFSLTIHPWCMSPSRDEAVRASEDGREGPLPTLEEAISRAGQFAPSEAPQEQKCTERESVTDRRPVDAGGGENVTGFDEAAKCSPAVSKTGETQSGLRTERITLEITHSVPVAQWDWTQILETYRPGESVRIVEEPDFLDIAQVMMQRDSAIRERDEVKQHHARECAKCGALADKMIALRARVADLESQLESVACRAATAENRVDELESASKLASPANADGKSNHSAPAASGAAGTGWLTGDERLAVSGAILIIDQHGPTNIGRTLNDILARSSPPEVGNG